MNSNLTEEEKAALRKYKRQYYAKNRERIREYQRKWNEANPGKQEEYKKRWLQKMVDDGGAKE